MKLSTIILAALLALGAATQDAKPTAFGVSEGDPVPLDQRRHEDAGDALRIAAHPAVAGFDRVLVVYTESRGACKVIGQMVAYDPEGDSYGREHKRVADKLVARVVDKLGREPTEKYNYNYNVDTFDALFGERRWVIAFRSEDIPLVRWHGSP